MKATLRVHYYVGNSMSESYEEKVDVVFREPTPEEAPLAVVSEDATTRWFEGRHFRAYEYRGSYAGDPTGATDAEEIVEHFQTSPHPLPVGYLGGYMFNGYFTSRPQSGDKKFSEKRYPAHVTDPKRIAEVEGAKAFARDVIVVDGMLWVACAEPKLVFDKRIVVDTRHQIAEDTWARMNYARPSISTVASTYRVDEMEEFMAHLRKSGVEHEAPDVEVLLPESIVSDRRSDNVILAAKLMLQLWSGKRTISDIHPDIGVGLFGISRQMWKLADEDIDREALADALGASVRQQIAMGVQDGGFAKVCDDWLDRPIAVVSQQRAATLG